MPKSQNSGFSPRLREVKDNFPMPGKYHFRFKSPLIPGSDREKNAVSVWLDCSNDNQHVGVWRNTIVAKVSRISMDDEDDDVDFPRQSARNGQTSAAPVQTQPQRPPVRHTAQPQQQRRAAPPVSAPAPAPVPASDNLLGFDDNKSPPPSNGSLLDVDNHAPAPRSAGEGSLLDMHGPSYNGSTGNIHATSSHDDFLGMTSTPVATAPTPAPAPVAPAPSSYGMPPNSVSNGGAARPNKAFDTFAAKTGPFGGLEWK